MSMKDKSQAMSTSHNQSTTKVTNDGDRQSFPTFFVSHSNGFKSNLNEESGDDDQGSQKHEAPEVKSQEDKMSRKFEVGIVEDVREDNDDDDDGDKRMTRDELDGDMQRMSAD